MGVWLLDQVPIFYAWPSDPSGVLAGARSRRNLQKCHKLKRMANERQSKGPGVKIPPPLIAASVMLAAYGFHQWVPLTLPASLLVRGTGAVLLLAGVLISVASVASFIRNRTAIEPWKPARALITDGLYRYSRNPIYLSFYLIQAGMGLFLAQGWMVLGVIVTEGWIYRLVIKREEAYLEQAFGDEYRRYKSRVRRYL